MINLERVKNILLNPSTEWPVIEQEADSIGDVVTKYLIWLLALSAVATFIKYAVFGTGIMFNVKIGAGTALIHAIAGIITGLISIYLVSLIVNALAAQFGATKNAVNAFKLVAYTSTASLVGSVFLLVPFIGFLISLLAGIYGIYLFYLGLPVLMKNPPDKSVIYTVVSIICAIVLMFVVGMVSNLFLPSMTDDSTLKISAAGKEITVPGKTIDSVSDKIEQATNKIEEASKSGNPGDVAKAAAGALSTMLGGKDTSNRQPISAETLKSFVPQTMGEFKRSSFEVESQNMFGIDVSSIKGVYKLDDQRLSLNITDLGAASSLTALAGWALNESEKETEQKHERTFRQGKRMISESDFKDGSRSSYKAMLENGVSVEVTGRKMSLAQLKQLLTNVDLDALEAAK